MMDGPTWFTQQSKTTNLETNLKQKIKTYIHGYEGCQNK